MQIASYYKRLDEARRLLYQVTEELSSALAQQETIENERMISIYAKVQTVLTLVNHPDNSI